MELVLTAMDPKQMVKELQHQEEKEEKMVVVVDWVNGATKEINVVMVKIKVQDFLGVEIEINNDY
jgi:hypothetical protein